VWTCLILIMPQELLPDKKYSSQAIKEERGKGYASEALDLMIKYSFNRLRLHQIYSNVMKGQKASLDLFKKKNFKTVGIKKQWLLVEKEWIDEYMLQLINPESSKTSSS